MLKRIVVTSFAAAAIMVPLSAPAVASDDRAFDWKSGDRAFDWKSKDAAFDWKSGDRAFDWK